MLVPSAKLLRLTALVVLPFATLAGVVPASAPIAVGLVVAFALLVIFDALRGVGVLDGIDASLPSVIRLTKGRLAEVSVQLRNESQRGRTIRLGLALPSTLTTPHETLEVRLPEQTVLASLNWPLTALERGTHPLRALHLEAPSPIGFWEVRCVVATACEVRVYPDLLNERRALAAVFLNRGSSGVHAQRQLGRGREFEKLREYLPGDSVDDIHWKATAKRSHPVTKVFQIERTQEVYVVVDASRLSAREGSFQFSDSSVQPANDVTATSLKTESRKLETPPASEPILERCLRAALILGAAAEMQGDLFGLVAFDDQVRRFVRARNGRAHFAACRDALHALQARPVTPDFEELCSFLRLRLRRRALLILLTSLDDPVISESFIRGVKLIAQQHLVLVVQPRPRGARPLFENPDVTNLDEVFAELGGHLRWQNLRALEQVLRRHGVGYKLVNEDALASETVRQYLDVKRRQAL